MSKVRMYILTAVATAGIGLGGTFGALAVMPINGNLVGATAPAPELQKVYYYNRSHADSTGEPTAVATTVAMLTTLATTVAMLTTLATTVPTTLVTTVAIVVIGNVVLVA